MIFQLNYVSEFFLIAKLKLRMHINSAVIPGVSNTSIGRQFSIEHMLHNINVIATDCILEDLEDANPP